MTSADEGANSFPGWTGPSDGRRSYFVPNRAHFESGGLGVVYRATVARERFELPPGTPVAVKVFTGEIAPERFEKLRIRGAALSQVVHPNLARFVEAFYGPPFVDVVVDETESTERLCVHVWVEGESLAARCEAAPVLDVLEWGRQAAEGLDFLHGHPLGPFAHRDIHPRNIIISNDGVAVLIDFDTILVDDPRGIETRLLLPGTRFAPIDRRAGLAGAQQDDRWSLAKTVLYALARDPQGHLSVGEAASSAVTNLTGSAADPRGVVDRLVGVLDGKDPASASVLFQRLMWPVHHKRRLPRAPAGRPRSSRLSSGSAERQLSKRWWFRLSVVASAALIAGGVLEATLGTSPPSGGGGMILAGVSCRTTTFCVAAGDKAAVLNGSSWAQSATTDSSDFISGVSCASKTFCIAVDSVGDALSFNGNAWSLPQNIDFSRPLESVSCPTPDLCVAVDEMGNIVRFTGGSWSAPQSIDATNFIVDISCVGSGFCIAVDDRGEAVATGGGSWSAPLKIDSTSSTLDGISCPTTRFCVIVDNAGRAIIYTDKTFESPRTIDRSRAIEGVSCVSPRFCVAVDHAGNEMTFRGKSWSKPVPIDPSRTIERVSCVSARYCVAVDNAGDEMTLSGGSWSAPQAII